MLKKSKLEKKGSPAWMTTYSDMVTLLLTFFVLLYSFSSIDADKWQRLVVAFTGDTSIFEQKSELHINQQQAGLDEITQLQQQLKDFQELYEKLKAYVESSELDTKILLNKTDNEIQIRFTDNVLFDSGKANLKDEALEILSKITVAIRTYEQSIQMIRIEGHTDNVPINTAEFPSNWELSTARAVTVLKFLIQNQNLSPEMLSAVGYGEYHNIAGNDTAEGRAKNRRVDFVIARSADKNTAQ